MQFERKNITLGAIEIYLNYFSAFEPEEFTQLLNPSEIERMKNFKHLQRRREFIATRLLKKELFGDKHILYNDHGAPFIDDEGYISISHSANCSAIAVCPNFALGLDLEKCATKASLLHTKFLNDQELTFLNPSDSIEMTQAWSCKEAMYKLAGRKGIIFKNDLILESKLNSEWEGTIINPTEIFFVKLLTILDDNIVISINTSEIESRNTK